MVLRRLLYIVIILFSSSVFSQLSKTHYVPPITSGISNAIPNDQYIYISTPNDGLVNFSIKRADGVELQSGQVSNANPDRKSTRLNSSHSQQSRMPSSA